MTAEQRTGRLLHWGSAVGIAFLLALLWKGAEVCIERCRGNGALEKWEAEMRAKGEKFTLAEIIPQPPPKEGNGAPALLPVAAELDQREEESDAGYHLLVPLHYVSAGKAVRLLDLPVLPRYSHGRGKDRSASPPPCSWEELKREVVALEPWLKKLREALRQPVFAMAPDDRPWDQTADIHRARRGMPCDGSGCRRSAISTMGIWMPCWRTWTI